MQHSMWLRASTDVKLGTERLLREDSDHYHKLRFLAVSLGVDEKVSLQVDF